MEQISKRLMNWASILEDKTREQAIQTSQMPFVYPHLALMPDAHLGKGSTVGSVIPTHGAIMPAAVGVDIGCGMMAVKTQYDRFDLDGSVMQTLHDMIADVIPLSAGNYNTSIYSTQTQRRIDELQDTQGIEQAAAVSANWDLQLGTLGSGNHFIEVSIDEEDKVWLFLHSGSRGVGNRLAVKHIKVAQQLCQKWFIDLPDPDLAYLVEGTKEFWSYMEALRWAQKFAYLNREEMMHRVIDVFDLWLGQDNIEPQETINCHHNYTVQEKHFGKLVWLSRKGAIDANEGVRGLIPGSMGAASYVVTGKGNRLSLCSSPHGAGRNHSRNVAKKMFNRESLDERMKGIAWGHSDEFLDEHPDAYKDIDVIMKDAEDLVSIDHTLHQICNVKGN
jgi:tRNA-splicing ligase RtcB